jgi:16S rRNA (cytosine967-C5)-methyltransferase
MNQDFKVSYNALRQIYAEEGYSNIAINEALENERNCSPGFVRYVVKEVLRRSFALDYKIASLSKNGMRGMKSKTKVLLRLGIFLLDEVDSIPDAVCVNEIVNLAAAVNRPNKGFINGVLRAYLRQDKNILLPSGNDRKSLSIRYSCHEKLVQLLEEQYGGEAIRILEAYNQPALVALRNNPMKQPRSELLMKLKELGVDAEASSESANGILVHSGSIIQNDLFRNGAYSVQGISSQLAIAAAAPTSGECVLDMCAAPGGKTTGMSELMGDIGSIEAWDIHPHRVELIMKNASRLGLQCIHGEINDATKLDTSKCEQYDLVVADVPCSGLGTIPVKPEIKLHWDNSGYRELTQIQQQILQNAWRYVKTGGRVMYSTCTINRMENEEVIDSFLASEPSATVVEKNLILPYNKTGFFYTILKKSK